MKKNTIIRLAQLTACTACLLLFLHTRAWAGDPDVPATVESEETVEETLLDESEEAVIVDAIVNSRYLRQPNEFAIVCRNGFNAKRALFIADATPFALYEALAELYGTPGDNLELDSPAGTKTEGDPLNVYVTWEGADADYPLEELVIDDRENEFDIRFSGNLGNSEEVSSGTLLCLDSCPVGVTSNANWGYRDYARGKVSFKVNRKLLPPNGTPVKIIFELDEE